MPERATLGRTVADAGGHLTPIRIMQMDCPTEEALIRSALGDLPGVLAMEFNLLQRILTVRHDATALDGVLDGIRQLGFTPELAEGTFLPTRYCRNPPQPGGHWRWPVAWRSPRKWLTHWSGQSGRRPALLFWRYFPAAQAPTAKAGWRSDMAILNINALMSIAVSGAF